MKKQAVCLLLLFVMLLPLALMSGCSGADITSDTLYVKKVENIPADFIFGMDASCVPAIENSGVKYYYYSGNEAMFTKLSPIPASTI